MWDRQECPTGYNLFASTRALGFTRGWGGGRGRRGLGDLVIIAISPGLIPRAQNIGSGIDALELHRVFDPINTKNPSNQVWAVAIGSTPTYSFFYWRRFRPLQPVGDNCEQRNTSLVLMFSVILGRRWGLPGKYFYRVRSRLWATSRKYYHREALCRGLLEFWTDPSRKIMDWMRLYLLLMSRLDSSITIKEYLIEVVTTKLVWGRITSSLVTSGLDRCTAVVMAPPFTLKKNAVTRWGQSPRKVLTVVD